MAAQTDKSTQSSPWNFATGAFGDMARKQADAVMDVQKELFNRFEEMNRAWFSRVQSEANLASELVSKLATARSIPDAAAACQECMSRQLEMFAEDSKRMLLDSEKLVQAGARLVSPGSAGLST